MTGQPPRFAQHSPLLVHDAHTHLSGSHSGESAQNIVACLDAVGVASAFVFAPLLDVQSWHLTDGHLEDIRAHNDYAADVCSQAPDRLLGFCVLNPAPGIAGGSIGRAVDLMGEEAGRCYHELGLRGVKMVPSGWYPNDPQLARLYRALADLGMYVVFHSGIFADGQEGSFCRPSFFEAIRCAPELKVQLAHVGWPWVDEAIAVLDMETILFGDQPDRWQFKADLSFGPPDDWQLEAWQKSLDCLPHSMLCYASDGFWPMEPEHYREQYLQPQLGLFEVAMTNGHLAREGSPERMRIREQIFGRNALDHWHAAVREPQRPKPASERIQTGQTRRGNPLSRGQRRRAPSA
jgi:predicted TIM-barrel fold metal-dependent hydrolase